MKQPALIHRHGILVVTEPGQRLLAKTLPQRLGIRVGDRIIKTLKLTVMISKPGSDQGSYLAGDGVHRKMRLRRYRVPRRQGLAIILIKVPAAAFRLAFWRHQQATAATHLTIEELHPQLLAPRGPVGEPLRAAEKPLIRQQGQFGPVSLTLTKPIQQPPFPGLGQQNAFRLQPAAGTRQFAIQRAAVGRVVQLDVINAEATATQVLGKMPHGREDKQNLLRVMGNVAPLLLGFHHEDTVPRRIGAGQAADGRIKLVTQQQNQITHVSHSGVQRQRQPHRRLSPDGQRTAWPHFIADIEVNQIDGLKRQLRQRSARVMQGAKYPGPSIPLLLLEQMARSVDQRLDQIHRAFV